MQLFNLWAGIVPEEGVFRRALEEFRRQALMQVRHGGSPRFRAGRGVRCGGVEAGLQTLEFQDPDAEDSVDQ